MATEPVYFPAGVADPDGRAGYVGDGAGIVSVALRHGQPLWRTRRAERPLISDGVRVAAAGGADTTALVVVLLDAREDGEPTLVSDPVGLPGWAAPATPGGEGFRIRARIDGDALRLDWEARAAYHGGAAPSAQVEREASRGATGAVRVDLQSGAVSPLPPEEAALGAVPRPPLNRDDLAEPWQTGAGEAWLEWDVDERGQLLTLKIEGTAGGEVKAVELARGELLVADVTPDGLHVLVHSEARPPGEDGDWLVFSARTGERVATLPHDAGAHSPAIIRGHAFYLVDRPGDGTTARTLRARALADGSLAWELPLAARTRTAAPPPRQ